MGSDSCAAGQAGEKHFSPRIAAILLAACRGFHPRAPTFAGLRPRTPGYFLYGQKVTKKTHRGGTLSMGSRPYVPHPHDDAKGDARPPLESPA